MEITNTILDYITQHKQEAFDLLVELAQIPAPSNHEEQRAKFCFEWLQKQGAQGVYIDEALNVVYPIGCGKDNPIVVFMAHSDVVFPDTDPLPLTIEDGKIFCPGVGDDTANVVALMMAAKYIAQNELSPREYGVLLVINSGEEGLGNLKGSRRIMDDFGERIQEFISFDGNYRRMSCQAVGSKRYRVQIETEGGHSYSAFGNRNAIAYLASLIDTLYSFKVPTRGKTTYNVGTISGGTSVNTIAQHAEMLYEFRSDDRDDLAEMEQHFNAAIDYYKTKGIQVSVNLVGDRPCSGYVDPQKHKALIDRAAAAIKKYFGEDVGLCSGSTDCNTFLSQGIPSVCPGCVDSQKSHTREEYIMIDSLHPGLNVAFELILHHF